MAFEPKNLAPSSVGSTSLTQRPFQPREPKRRRTVPQRMESPDTGGGGAGEGGTGSQSFIDCDENPLFTLTWVNGLITNDGVGEPIKVGECNAPPVGS